MFRRKIENTLHIFFTKEFKRYRVFILMKEVEPLFLFISLV